MRPALLLPFAFVLVAAAVAATGAQAQGAGAARRSAHLVTTAPRHTGGGEMVTITGGGFRSLYGARDAAPVRVETFRLDRDPVTRAEFLAFVQAHPQWRKGAVRGVHADRATYLKDWPSEVDAGDRDALRRPVTWVSWSAARAYCTARGKRLPTVNEWEYAAAASASARDATRDAAFVQGLTAVYAMRGRDLGPVDALAPNAWGVRGLHEMTWEWVEDFNSVLVSDDSRGVGAREFDQVCASAAIGATDPTNYAAFLRFAVRAGLEGRDAMGTLGFRCAA